MGCDGGTIPTRDELVQTKKNPEKKDNDSVRLYKWQCCHLTQEKLVQPIVACQLGQLYNKEAIIKVLLKRKKIDCGEEDEHVIDSKVVDHIRSLKDIQELKLTGNPSYDVKEPNAPTGDGSYIDMHKSAFICPVSRLEMNGTYSFLYDWNSGNVLSERGYKVIKNDPSYAVDEGSIIFLNPETNSVQADLNRTNLNVRKAKAKKLKRSLKCDAKSESDKETCDSKKLKLVS